MLFDTSARHGKRRPRPFVQQDIHRRLLHFSTFVSTDSTSASYLRYLGSIDCAVETTQPYRMGSLRVASATSLATECAFNSDCGLVLRRIGHSSQGRYVRLQRVACSYHDCDSIASQPQFRSTVLQQPTRDEPLTFPAIHTFLTRLVDISK